MRLFRDSHIRTAALTVSVAFLILGLALALTVWPYQRIAQRLPRSGVAVAPPWRKRQISDAVRRASKLIPGATCLPQAMAGYVLLSNRGLESRIRIGVLQEDGAPFRAHAVLMSGSDVLIGGGGDADKFVIITELRPGF